jgi:CubicO group peptidase (beta-lactamase class C family)
MSGTCGLQQCGPSLRLLAWCALVLPGAAFGQHSDGPSRAPMAALDGYVAKAVQEWRVPGLAVAVVHGDTVVFAKGYGVRHIGRPEPIGVHTIFGVASTTKAMTAAVMGMLVDSGRARWDDAVIQHMPEFRIADPYVTREMTIRDLLTHRGGLPITDYLWDDTAATFADVMHRLPYLRPAYSIRAQFIYQNVMYATAGHVEGLLAGTTWDDLIQHRLFGPLGMSETKTSTHQLDFAGDVATPHARVHDSLSAIPWRNLDAIGPAGSVNSSVSDMARWIRFLLDSGRVDGKRLISPAVFHELFTPQAIVPLDFYPAWREVAPRVVTYGLGWFLFDYHGHRAAMHTGSIDGMSTILGLLPDDRVGVVVLVNQDHAELRHALLLRTFDTYLGGASRDWSTDLLRLYAGEMHKTDSTERAQEATRIPGATPSLPVGRYVGVYRDSLYGSFVVRLERGALVGQRGPWIGDLEPWGYDTFRFRLRHWSRAATFVTTVLSPKGEVAELRFDDGRRYERTQTN